MRRAAILLAAALTLLAGEPDRKPSAARVDPYADLTQAQRECCESPARRKIVTGSRRSGKTHALVARLVRGLLDGKECLYVSLTRKLAKRTIWKRLKALVTRLVGEAAKVNESELSITLGEGTIELGGADDAEAIERYRGPSYGLVIIDECGSQPRKLLTALVTDVLRPTLMDNAGELVLAGTPSPVLEGYWFEQAAPDGMRTSTAPRWEWTIYDNPIFAGRADAELAAVREEHGWDESSISYRREYLGHWVRDESLLVYPYSAERNGIAELPQRTARGYPVSPSRWRHVIGVDVGTTQDAMAIVVMCSHPALTGEYIVHAEAHTGMLTDHLVARLQVLLLRFPRAQIALDSGGMGAAHALEVAAAGLPIVAAKKTEKASAIRVLHDRVIGGRIKLLTVPSLDGLRKEWGRLGWDDDHLQHHPDQADHYSDATLYALRELRHYYTREDLDAPPKDPRVEDDDEADARSLGLLQRVGRLFTFPPMAFPVAA